MIRSIVAALIIAVSAALFTPAFAAATASAPAAAVAGDAAPAPVQAGSPDAALASPDMNTNDLVYQDPGETRKRPSLFFAVLRVLFSLSLVAGLVFLAGYAFKKYVAGRPGFMGMGGGVNRTSLVNVLGTTYLGARRQICVVEVMERILVLGVTENQIQLITEIDNKAFAKTLKDRTPAGQPDLGQFMAQFAQPSGKPGFMDYLTRISEQFK